MASNVTELRPMAEADTQPKIELPPVMCQGLEGTIIKLGVLEHALERLDRNLSLTNAALARLNVAIEELTHALVRK